MDQHDPAREPGERQGFLQGRIAAADDRHPLAAQQRRVAARALADAAAGEPVGAGHAEGLEGGPGGEDQRRGFPLTLPGLDDDAVGAGREAGERRRGEFGAARRRLELDVRAQAVALHPVREAGIAVDAADAEEMSPGRVPGQHQGRGAEARRVQPGGQPGNAAAGDDDVEFRAHRRTPSRRTAERLY